MMADGHNNQCKLCVKAYQITIKDKLKAYQRDYQPQYKAEHKEELKEYLNNYQRTVYKEKHYAYIAKWKAVNPDKVAQYRKNMIERKQQNGE